MCYNGYALKRGFIYLFYEKLFARLLRERNGFDMWNCIVVDGVVGCGKTTLMTILEEEGFVPFPEPVVDNPILDKFYYDRTRYSFLLQVFFLNRRFKHIKEASKIENAIMDRSIYGDVIFAKMLHDTGEMSDEEFHTYLELFNNMIEHCKAPKLMIYLEISVDKAIERIKKRGRDFELITEMAYWERLNENYQEYFTHYNFSPILRINMDNLDFENCEEDRKYVLNLIYNKLQMLNSDLQTEAI